jgi:hypothetical protein
MGLAKTKEKLFDIRIAGRYIDKGIVTREDREKYLASLKDAEKNFETVPMVAILGEEGAGLGRRKHIAGYTHRKVRDYSGVRFEDEEFGDELAEAEYGVDEDLSTRTIDELDESDGDL